MASDPTDPTRPTRPVNRLLARLPRDDYERLRPHLQRVSLPLNRVLYEARGPIHHAYFPAGAVISALAVMLDGSAIEVATVGAEGMIGHDAASGARTSPNQNFVQVAGDGLRIEVGILRDEAARGGTLRDVLSDYQSAFMAQVSQSVACNGLHRLEQRCCRWLLMTRDRVATDDLPLTHEFLALMLGARRASVTEALKPLQDSGLVHCRRGLIRLLDRPRVEALSCECYRVVKDEYDRLLGPHP